ncbi:MAG: hypothetical protein H7210_01190 [Pyrinomonadaceae bacterium]|nr:hypothetical protein [Phycisphaerales bacterium]
MKNTVLFAGLAAGLMLTAVASARPVPNGVVAVDRLFNDYPNSTLTVTNNYPAQVQWNETNFGNGGFANRHARYFSADGGASAIDWNYADAFDLALTVDLDATPVGGREAGFHTDLFGLGIFGVLPNGEIAAFGSILPFHSFGNVWAPGTPVRLQMIHTPGNGDGVTAGTIPSTIEYRYDLGAGAISSGAIPFTTTEGGIPSNFNFLVGFGVQNAGAAGGTSNANFTNIVVPAPGAAALLGLGGLAMIRRRR